MLVDDHILFREGIKKILELENNIEVVEEANNGRECLEKIKLSEIELLLLDICMPELNGMEVLKEIKNKGYDVKVIILTADEKIETLKNAIEIGAEGYLLKSSDSKALIKAINMVMNNELYFDPVLLLEDSQISTDSLNNKAAEKISNGIGGCLTKRELDILREITNGRSNKEISLLFNISERTVKNHISNILKKLKLSDRTQAAVFAIKNNII